MGKMKFKFAIVPEDALPGFTPAFASVTEDFSEALGPEAELPVALMFSEGG